MTNWPYPGSRWWKFDFHTHTPASADARAWLAAVGTPDEVTPEFWLLKYMAAEIDCVAVTDHNSGAWIDQLKAAYAEMDAWDEAAKRDRGFRELTLFPGVEISVNGGIHVLAVFGPDAGGGDIDSLLGAVEYSGTKGDSDGETRKSVVEVIECILSVSAIPIPAHADGDKGLLQVNPGTRQSVKSATTIRQAINVDGLLAVEWVNPELPMPTCVEREAAHLARVLGSDCHNFRNEPVPGSRYTWVKMSEPSIEGLRLALLDGNGISIRRSDQGNFDPFRTPEVFITAIDVHSARFMGRREPERLEFSPYYNALIGGRGTGKSTVVHAARLVFRREAELKSLGDESEPRKRFESFGKTAGGRDGDGGLLPETELRVELRRDGREYRLNWSPNGSEEAVEECCADGGWVASGSQAINAERFPVRIFSQGQIAAMAGDGRQALIDVIDEAAGVAELKEHLRNVENAWSTQRARQREIDARLVTKPEVERKLREITDKLSALQNSHHADVYRSHQIAARQQREVNGSLQQLLEIPARIESLRADLLIDDWAEGVFAADNADADILAWRNDADNALSRLREELNAAGERFAQRVSVLGDDPRLQAWNERVAATQGAYEDLQNALAAQGISDPQAFARLVQERQGMETHLGELQRLEGDKARCERDIDVQWQQVSQARRAIGERRASFLTEKLQHNKFVRIKVVPLGFDPRVIERSLRELLDAKEHFENDILRLEGGEPDGGLAFDLATAQGDAKSETLAAIKQRFINPDDRLGGHFRNFLARKLQRPEFIDAVLRWFPEDDLHIEYSRHGDGSDWVGVGQGSQGQRSAALLAFLLAFGEEPLILDQPEDDLDNHLIYDLIVKQVRENKLRRQLIVVTHNPNVVVNGDAEMVHALDFRGQCYVKQRGGLQQKELREEVCRVMEGGREAFRRRWARLGREL
jgi:energy-coupling factor transporter ATP-binding protein EcfA2